MLSPLLFNIVVDMLSIMINRAKREGQFSGVVPHLVDDGLSILQYADDTIIFLDHDLEAVKNLKLLLCAFEQLLGLKINYHKSEIFCFGGLRRHRRNTQVFLDVKLVHNHLNTLVFQCTIKSSIIMIGK
jgi:hypothetical protein